MQSRRSYSARGDDDELLGPSQPEILDKQEQRQQVQQLVDIARDSLRLHRILVSAIQVVLSLVLAVKSERHAARILLAILVLPLSVLLARDDIARSLRISRTALQALLLVPCAIYALHISFARQIDTSDRLIWALAPGGLILLRIATELEGQKAIREAQDLTGLMYDAPEA